MLRGGVSVLSTPVEAKVQVSVRMFLLPVPLHHVSGVALVASLLLPHMQFWMKIPRYEPTLHQSVRIWPLFAPFVIDVVPDWYAFQTALRDT